MQTVCTDCGGKGEIIKEEDKCKNCKGKKVLKDKKVLEVQIDKGMKHGQKIVFSGEADETPGMEAGDIIFVLIEKKHELFKRNGNDLYLEYTLPLTEALCGFGFTIKHLDDREILIKSDKGDVIRPSDVRVIPGEGMPTHKRPFEKGNLYIQFNIEFPKGPFSVDNVKQLEKVLGARRPIPNKTPEMEETLLKKPDFEGRGGKKGRRGEEEEEEEEGQGGQRVQCAQQ